MFPAYPKFEDFSLRVEVQWQGRAHWVAARLEQWPEVGKPVLVCEFEDKTAAGTDGEWLVLEPQGDRPHFVFLPSFAPEKARRLIRQVFERRNLTAGRLFVWPQLDAPNIALTSLKRRAFWLNGWRDVERDAPMRARWSLRFPVADASVAEIETRVLREVGRARSETHFSYWWAGLSPNEKRVQLTGFKGDFGEISRIMNLVLRPMKGAQPRTGWEWQLSCGYGIGFRCWHRANTSAQFTTPDLRPWEKLLLPHYLPQLQMNWYHQHSCIKHFMRKELQVLGEATIKEVPTAHEQLEAKLALRKWLRDKALPAVTARLLASLEE